MSFQIIYERLNSISPITHDAWIELRDLLRTKSLSRNEYLVREGTKVNDCYFLVDGVIRVFYNKDGNEYNKTFFIPGMFPTALTALISNSVSAISFQALTLCDLIAFSYSGFKDLARQHRCLETLLLRIIELEWIKKERHDIHMVTNDATTNYLIFRESFPGLEDQIPQYQIASYLGITPIQLSRIRSKLAQSS